MATHAPITGAQTRATIIPFPVSPGATLTAAQRLAIEDQIESLIALLDGFDAPFEDLEAEEDRCGGADDGCGPLEPHQARWGRDAEDALAVPKYGLDQRGLPINYQSASRDHQAAVMGLVRSPTGRWRKPH